MTTLKQIKLNGHFRLEGGKYRLERKIDGGYEVTKIQIIIGGKSIDIEEKNQRTIVFSGLTIVAPLSREDINNTKEDYIQNYPGEY